MTTNINDIEHIVRCCPQRYLDHEGKPEFMAFKIQPKDQGCLSVVWLEHFGKQTVADNIPLARDELCKNYKTTNDNKLAVLNVGVMKQTIKQTHGIDINVRTDPDEYPSHACIEGYPTNDEAVATTLSDMARDGRLYPGCPHD